MEDSDNRTEIIVHAYDWEIEDCSTDDGDKLAIHAWCLDRESNPYLLRIEEFPAFCQVELPMFIGNNLARWTKDKVDTFVDVISNVLQGDAPVRHIFKMSKKCYYYRGGRTYPMVTLVFNTIKAMDHCSNLLNKPIKIDLDGFGLMKCNVWEKDISSVRKLLTMRNTKYSQWFRIRGEHIQDEDLRISTLKNEYTADWQTMIPIPPSESKKWMTYPKTLSFDIEAYSDNHKAMPIKYSARHVSYMISCITQRLGDLKSRKRIGIIYGDCNNIPPDKLDDCTIIKVNTEVEMINEFGRVMSEYDPEVVLGYNILNFDYPYLDHRLKRVLKDWPYMGRLKDRRPKLNSKTWKSDAYGYMSINILKINGRISVDLYPVIKRDNKLDKYDLDTVSFKFIKKNKHAIKPEEQFRIYEELQRALEEKKKLDVSEANADDGDNSNDKINEFLRNVTQPSDTSKEEIDEETQKNREKEENLIKQGVHEELRRATIALDELSPDDPLSLRKKIMERYEKAKEEMTRVMAYCIQDAELVIDLMEKLRIWIGLIELSNIVGVTLMELFTRGQQCRCISQLYDLAAKLGFVIDKRETPPHQFGGGFVFEPKPGIYDNIICLDFASLYPSIIRAFNICYTTLVPPELDNEIPDELCNVIEFDQEEDDHTPDDAEDDDVFSEKKKKTKKPKKIVHYRFKFKKEPEGLLPQLVRQLVDGRNAVKAEMKGEKDEVVLGVLDSRQLALKVSANSFFGFLGVGDGGVMPLIEGAMSITAKGRELIGLVNKYIKDKYNGDIVYGDTDSSMADLHITDKTKVNYWGKRLSEEISGTPEVKDKDGNVTKEAVKGLFPSPLKMEFEKAMRLLCIKKKKYAAFLIGKDGEFEKETIKGDDGVTRETGKYVTLKKGIVLARRETPPILRRIYGSLLESTLLKKPFDEVMDILIDAIKALSQGKIDFKELIAIRSLGSNYKSDTYFVKLFADELRKLGKPANPGDRLEFIIVKDENARLLGHRMRSPEVYSERLGTDKEEKIDYMYYIEKILMNSINQLIEVGYKNIIQSEAFKNIGYKPSGRSKFIGLDKPVKILFRMLEKGLDLELLRTAIKRASGKQIVLQVPVQSVPETILKILPSPIPNPISNPIAEDKVRIKIIPPTENKMSVSTISLPISSPLPRQPLRYPCGIIPQERTVKLTIRKP
jgi:DNA polymerase elongation subunit (family B)